MIEVYQVNNVIKQIFCVKVISYGILAYKHLKNNDNVLFLAQVFLLNA
jgi:hypothetical protein